MALNKTINGTYQPRKDFETDIELSSLNGYDFTLTAKKNIFFTLSELQRDLDLYVVSLDKNGDPLAIDGILYNAGASSNPGVEDEGIFLQLKPGSWRVYVRENLGTNLEKPLKDGNFNYKLEIDSQSFLENAILTNDPFLDYQWHLFNTGLLNSNLVTDAEGRFAQSITTPNIDILAPEAWKLRTDGSDVILAIIDGGVDLTHPDLKENLWVNPLANQDDQYKNDIHGWDFVNDSPNIIPDDHGTHVAGIAAAKGNNGIGVAGVAWNAKIMSLDVFAPGKKDGREIIDAMHYAIDHGAKVINMSLGGNRKISASDIKRLDLESEYRAAFQKAYDKDVFIAVAAGNEGDRRGDLNHFEQAGNMDVYSSSPAYFNQEFSNVASVVSSDSSANRSPYSNYGMTTSIAAPGGDISKSESIYVPKAGDSGEAIEASLNYGILSTFPVGKVDSLFGDGYGMNQGTSMSAPVISGMATLIRSANSSITAPETLAILRAGATVESTLKSYVNGGKSANLYGSLLLAENWTGPSDLLKVDQSAETPIINLSFLTGAMKVKGEVTVSRNAAFDPITGFYQAINEYGHVYDSLGNVLKPGDENYSASALAESNIVSSISNVSLEDGKSVDSEIVIEDSAFIAPFSVVNGETWFAFADANTDGFAHFKMLGDNTFGLEDIRGGGDQDFDDHIISFKATEII